MTNALARLPLIAKYAFPRRKPLYTLRLIAFVLRAYVLRSRPLRGVDFSIGWKCNLKCKHCFNTSMIDTSDRPTMGIKDYRRVVREAMRLGCIAFSIQGGEPLLYPELEEIVKALRPQWNRVPIATNATLLTRERLLSLRKCGVDTINVSMDSGIPEEHDRFRGVPGTFEKAVGALDEAISLGFIVSINMTLSRNMLYGEGFTRLLDFAHKKGILINTLFAAPAGNWKKSQEYLLRPEDAAYYHRLKAKYPLMCRDIDGNYGPRGCGAVNEMLFITSYGDVLVCPFIQIAIGNVFEEPLSLIRTRGQSTYLFGGYNPRCWIAEEAEFMKKYVSLMGEKTRLPIRWDSPEGKELLFDFRLSS